MERLQFVPDNQQGIVVQFVIKKTNQIKKNIQFEFTGHSDLRPTWLGERTNMHDDVDEAVLKTTNGLSRTNPTHGSTFLGPTRLQLSTKQ